MSDDIENAMSASTSTFVTALVFNAIVFAAEITAFTLLRPYFKAIYEPRTYIPAPSKRVEPLSASFLKWPIAVYNADYRSILKANGMDAYFFVRFLRMMVKVFLPIWFISWAVLMPTDSVLTQVGDNEGLDLFTYGNIQPDKQRRYAAHLILLYGFTIWVFYNIKTEMRHFVEMRQKHLIDPVHAKPVQANTLLITGIPPRYLTKKALLKLFNELPGGVKQIWINRNLKDLPDIYDRRLAACAKLESAETKLLSTAAKLRQEELKKRGSNAKAPTTNNEGPSTKTTASASDPEVGSDRDFVPLVPRDQRPQHRLGSIPFIGEKVDTIEWCRKEIEECNKILDAERKIIEEEDADDEEAPPEEGKTEERNSVDGNAPASAESSESGHHATAKLREFGGRMKTIVKRGPKKDLKYPPLNSAFVLFNKQIAAHLGKQALAHHEPYRMSGRYVEVAPEDVIWSNLSLNPYEMKIRLAISYAATAALILLWAFPVAFVGAISNIYSVCDQAAWLRWICGLPDIVVGIIAGILPPVLLAVLMMLLPIILRLLAQFEGIPKRTGLELSLMTRFFMFQALHSFLIVSFASGVFAALPGLLNNPTSVPTLLAQTLPKASTFFLTYVVLQGLAVTAGGFLQAVSLVLYYVKLFILGSTPRSIYEIKYGAKSVEWGTTFPGITLLTIIALGYSIISPIINGLACATFFAFYMLYKYLFLWKYEQTPASDTGGLFFPKAIQHIFVGLYIEEIVLCALFFLARDQNGKASSIPEGALAAALIVITAFFHAIINNSYGPLLHALPLSLADKTYTAPPLPKEEKKPEKSEKSDPSTSASTVPAPAPALPPSLAPPGKPKVPYYNPEGIEEDFVPNPEPTDVESTHSSTSPKPLPNADEPTPDQPTTERPPSLASAKAPEEQQKDEEAEYGFSHPAASRPQRTVWIPLDDLGLAKEEVEECRKMGVDVSWEGAKMNERGKVEIFGVPPDVRE